MRDFAISEDPAVQHQLDRLGALSLPQGRIGLEPIHALLAKLGNPQNHLPPVFHIAGTNGKGSTCAFLRAMLETAGLSIHAATKPHLVRYNERIRLNGALITDDALAAILGEVLDAAAHLPADLAPSFFEATTAAIFLSFSRTPADACVIEVGLGGRLDATNVIPAPAACGIATLGIDHEAFLLRPEAGVPEDPLARIAFEKAGIARPHAALVTQAYPPIAAHEVRAAAHRAQAMLVMRGEGWDAHVAGDAIHYRDEQGALTLPLPTLPGAHQADNAALAVAMLRHQSAVHVPPEAMAAGIRAARWPARLQRLGTGPLTGALSECDQIWLDGGHNPDAANAIASHFAPIAERHGRISVAMGMLTSKAAETFITAIAPITHELIAIPIPGHDHIPPHQLVEIARRVGLTRTGTAPDVETALAMFDRMCRPGDGHPPVLIAGSLYLAGEVLRLNEELPD